MFSLLLKIRDLLLVLRRIEIEVLEKLLINEETLSSNTCDQISLQNVSIQTTPRKRSNSVPENAFPKIEFNSENRMKSMSALSLVASNVAPKLSAGYDDNLSIDSIESTTTTTASVDSFEIALGMTSDKLFFSLIFHQI